MPDYTKIDFTCDLGDELLKVIGEIVVSFGQLERVIALTIKRAEPSTTLADAEALVIRVGADGNRAINSYQQLVMDQGLEADFEELMKKADAIAPRRHDVVHGHWGRDGNRCVRWQRKGEYKELYIDQLERLRDDIRHLVAEINQKLRSDLGSFEMSASSINSISEPQKN